MIVTIFSTKAFKPTDLFGGHNICSNPEATRSLNYYFRESIIIKYLREIEEDQTRKNQLRDIIISSLLKNNGSENPESILGEDVEARILVLYKDWCECGDMLSEEDDDEKINELSNKRKSIEANIKELVAPMPSGESFLDKCNRLALLFAGFSDNKSKIMSEFISELPEQSLALIGIGDNEKHNIFCLHNSDGNSVPGVFGVQCLSTPDSSNNWIPTLIDCAKKLPSADNSENTLSVQLILHDKDLSGVKMDNDFFSFAEKDVYVVSDDEKTVLVPDWQEKGISSLSIIFFHHTSNQFAKIVENVYDGTIIHEKIQSYVDGYFNNLEFVENEDSFLYS